MANGHLRRGKAAVPSAATLEPLGCDSGIAILKGDHLHAVHQDAVLRRARRMSPPLVNASTSIGRLRSAELQRVAAGCKFLPGEIPQPQDVRPCRHGAGRKINSNAHRTCSPELSTTFADLQRAGGLPASWFVAERLRLRILIRFAGRQLMDLLRSGAVEGCSRGAVGTTLSLRPLPCLPQEFRNL